MANAVSKSQLSRLAANNRSEEQRASSQDTEDFLKEIAGRYYFAFLDIAPRQTLTKAIAGFLYRAGRSIANDRSLDRVILEEKLRAALQSLDQLPPPVCAGSASSERPGLEPRQPPVMPVSSSQGEVKVPLTRLASEIGLSLDARVVKKARGEGDEASSQVVGTVCAVGEDAVEWAQGGGEGSLG